LPIAFAADVYDVYIGNSRNLNSGTPGLLLRDLRIWNGTRTEAEVKTWRHKSIDRWSNQLTQSSKLLANYRLDEGVLTGFLNTVTLTTTSASS
jgi:hypothetical protein